MKKRNKRGLSEDDKTLWSRVAATTNPMDGRVAPAITTVKDGEPLLPERPNASTTGQRLPAFRIGERAASSSRPVNNESTFASRHSPAPVKMDHATHRRMMRGKLKPEGRLDLHGMTLAEAHPALISFIFSAHGDGKRLVIVITGKGRDRDTGGPIPIRRGILRHQVPAWLTAPPLGAVVLEIREAHRKHGGGGAYYVYLKRNRYST